APPHPPLHAYLAELEPARLRRALTERERPDPGGLGGAVTHAPPLLDLDPVAGRAVERRAGSEREAPLPPALDPARHDHVEPFLADRLGEPLHLQLPLAPLHAEAFGRDGADVAVGARLERRRARDGAEPGARLLGRGALAEPADFGGG